MKETKTDKPMMEVVLVRQKGRASPCYSFEHDRNRIEYGETENDERQYRAQRRIRLGQW